MADISNTIFPLIPLRDVVVFPQMVTPLFVSKIGIGADVFEFAHRQPAIYGILAVLVAISAGWAASAVFRKS